MPVVRENNWHFFLYEFLDEQDMARLSDLKKFLDSQNPIRVKEAVTSNSKYYYFDSCIIRVSDHLDSKLQRNPNYLNIVSANNGDFVISVGGKTFSVNYDEAKKLIALVAAEQANKRSSAKADKIAEEIARLEKENEELRDKLKLINNKVSDLISEL